ncbi:MAG TPA: mannonate dehydratase, partial [Thermomicrobiales bacterium]|nr:mannonate dehydratase [Thermomicrobiales bacterium]
MDGIGTEQRMRVAVGQLNELSDEILAYTAQLGLGGIQLNTPRLPGERRWEAADLRRLVDRCRDYGLRLEAIENVPIHFYDEAMLGGPRRDEQIEGYRATIRHMGEAGIPILGYHFMPNSVWRTSRTTPGRGGSHVTSFDLALVGGTAAEQRAFVAKRDERLATLPLFDDAEAIYEPTMWANYAYFMRAVLPAAEEAWVKLALHPDDPPVPSLGGVARLFKDIAGFERALEIAAGSPAWGLDLCLGCCSEM